MHPATELASDLLAVNFERHTEVFTADHSEKLSDSGSALFQ